MIGLDYTWRDVWPRPHAGLPPGQRLARAMPRFGIKPGSHPPAALQSELSVTGDIPESIAVGTDQLTRLERVTLRADFHCVTTWTVRDLAWSGWRMKDVWDELIMPYTKPTDSITHIRAIGADRYTASLPLEDALAADVLIADRLEGRPLDPAHGAPLRLVAPAHYGYKNVKNLVALSLHANPPRTTGGAMQHPRARVMHEERHATRSGRLLRWPYRLMIIPIALRARASATRTIE